MSYHTEVIFENGVSDMEKAENMDIKNKNIYISGCTQMGGIYHYILCDGLLVFRSFTPVDRPMYSIINNGKLYVILRAPFNKSEDSGVVFFEIDDNGFLYNKSDITNKRRFAK